MFVESEIERSRSLKLDVRARLLTQGICERRIKITTRTRQLEKFIGTVRLSLRREHSGGSM